MTNHFVERTSRGFRSEYPYNSVLRSKSFHPRFTHMELVVLCFSLIPKAAAFSAFMATKNSTYMELIIIPSLCLDSAMSAFSLWRLHRLPIPEPVSQGKQMRRQRIRTALFFCVGAAVTSLSLVVAFVAALAGRIISVSRPLLWTVSYGNRRLATCSSFAGHCINPLSSVFRDRVSSVVALHEVCGKCVWPPKQRAWCGPMGYLPAP